MQILIGILVVCLTLCSFAWANDALATYEHNRYLVEMERSNQIQIHETSLTQREEVNAVFVSDAVSSITQPDTTFIPLPTPVDKYGDQAVVTVMNGWAQVQLDNRCNPADIATFRDGRWWVSVGETQYPVDMIVCGN